MSCISNKNFQDHMPLVLDAPTKRTQSSETLRGSIARVSCFPNVGENTDEKPPNSAWKGDWDNWKNNDPWQDSHKP